MEVIKAALIRAAAEELEWARANVRHAMKTGGRDANQLSAITGLSVGTIRGFLSRSNPTDSGTGNVLLISLALGISPEDLFRPPEGLAATQAAQQYDSLARENPDAIVTVRTIAGEAIYVSPSSRDIGYEPRELLDMSVEATLDLIHPEDRERMGEVLVQVTQMEGRRSRILYRVLRKDGRWEAREAELWVDRGATAEQVLIMVDGKAPA
jgi:PAS domain S-box-containing protein